MSRPSLPPSSLAKPTFETRYHIDYDWWERSGQELDSYLLQHLCDMHRREFAGEGGNDTMIDWIDPETGAVSRVHRLMYALLSHCSRQPEYVTERTSLVDAVFRVLLASGNRPMTPVELAERTGRSPDVILRTLSGRTIYKGVLPVTEG